MKKEHEIAANVDEYIDSFPLPVRKLLEQVRKVIRQAAPDAKEAISYQMPGYKLDGMLVYFAGWKNHLGFYPSTSGISNFKKELSGYTIAKGSVQFPYDKPLPLDLIRDIVKFRAQENREKAAAKKTPTKNSGKAKPAGEDPVDSWLNKQDTAGKKNFNTIRKIIRKVSPGISERIKWNAPSYHYKEKDFLTFGPYRDKRILLVFHHPGITKIRSPLLEGKHKDRRLFYFNSAAEIKKNGKELARIIKESLEKIK